MELKNLSLWPLKLYGEKSYFVKRLSIWRIFLFWQTPFPIPLNCRTGLWMTFWYVPGRILIIDIVHLTMSPCENDPVKFWKVFRWGNINNWPSRVIIVDFGFGFETPIVTMKIIFPVMFFPYRGTSWGKQNGMYFIKQLFVSKSDIIGAKIPVLLIALIQGRCTLFEDGAVSEAENN